MVGWTVGDFLCHEKASWQEEIYWTANMPEYVDEELVTVNIPKKAKTDVLLVHGGTGGIIDLKWTGSLPNFKKRLRGDKWIQAAHYEESVLSKYGVNVLPMLYVVGIAESKGVPPLVTALAMEDGKCTGHNRCFCGQCRRAEYERVSMAYHQWEIGGREPSGFLEAGEVKVWV